MVKLWSRDYYHYREQSRVRLPRRWVNWINAVRGDNKRGQGGTAFPMICCCGITGGGFGYSGHAVAALVVHINDIKGARQKISVPTTTIMLPVSTVPFQNARRIMNATIAPPPLFWKRMLLIVASVIAISCWWFCCKNQQGCNVGACVYVKVHRRFPKTIPPPLLQTYTQRHIHALSPAHIHTHIHILLVFSSPNYPCSPSFSRRPQHSRLLVLFFFPLVTFSFYSFSLFLSLFLL